MPLNILILYNPPLTAGRGGNASLALTAWEIRTLNLHRPSRCPFPRAQVPLLRTGCPQSQRDGEGRAHATNCSETFTGKKK